jgi:KaiC/GvpD/RAD55 family RecA-like ATPase
LETFIDSEVPLGSNILLVGPPGVGKTALSETLLCECLQNGIQALMITLDSPPKDVRKRLLNRGIDLGGETERIAFVDGYSWLVGESTEPYHVRNLSNISDLSVKMISAINALGKGVFFIVDSISTLLLYNAENEVQRFIEVNVARMKNTESVGLWVVEQGIHSASFYNVLRHMADGVLEMRFEEGDELKRFVRMHTFKGLQHNTQWKPFSVLIDGLITIKEGTHL